MNAFGNILLGPLKLITLPLIVVSTVADLLQKC